MVDELLLQKLLDTIDGAVGMPGVLASENPSIIVPGMQAFNAWEQARKLCQDSNMVPLVLGNSLEDCEGDLSGHLFKAGDRVKVLDAAAKISTSRLDDHHFLKVVRVECFARSNLSSVMSEYADPKAKALVEVVAILEKGDAGAIVALDWNFVEFYVWGHMNKVSLREVAKVIETSAPDTLNDRLVTRPDAKFANEKEFIKFLKNSDVWYAWYD